MRTGLLASVVFALSLAAPATAGAQSLVYALESSSVSCASLGSCHAPTVHVVDAAAARDLGTFTIGTQNDRGTALRLSSDGRLVLVTTVRPDTDAGTFWAVDAFTRQVVTQIAVGAKPSDIAVLPDNSRAYVVNNHSDSVSVIELASLTVVATIPVGHFPWRIAVSPDGNAVYLTNAGSASVSKISTTTNTLAATIGVGLGPLGLDISPDGSRLFVANKSDRAVSVIDANLDSVLRTLPAGTTSNPPIDVSAQSATRVFVALDDPAVGSLGPHTLSSVQLLNAADGAIVGSTTTGALQRFARAASGTPAYFIGTDTFRESLARIADDGTSATTIFQISEAAGVWNAAAVFADPCTVVSTATPATFGPGGGFATLTIAAPPGCAWTIDTSSLGGFSLGGSLSGSGPATRTISVAAADAPKLGTLVIGRQVVTLEQTIPRMNIDSPRGGGPVLQQPFTLSGWAIDQNLGAPTLAFRARGIDFLHFWAYPVSGTPIFVGSAALFGPRPDIAAIFGSGMLRSGFDVTVRNLPAGSYTLVAFAHSELSNSFIAAQSVSVSVARVLSPMVVDTPKPSSTVSGAFDVGGWAIDTAATSGSGVDAVQIWAYPASGASPVFVGAAAQTPRPDVAAIFGNQFVNSGFFLRGATLPSGTYDLVVFARSTVTGVFDNVRVVRITVQ